MSVENFMQTIWSKKIQDDLELKLKLIKNCTREYEGDCEYAKTVKILGVGEPTVSGYQGVVDYEDMSDRSQLLTIAFAEYFSFAVKDIDKAQSVPGLPEKYQQKATSKLAQRREINLGRLVAGKCISTMNEATATYAKTQDTSIATNKDYFVQKIINGKTIYQRVANPVIENKGNYYEITTGTYETGAKNITTAGDKKQASIKNAIDDGIVALRLRNFDVGGVVEIDPATYSAFKNNLIELSTNNLELIRRGVVGMYDNFEVVMSNAIYNDGTHRYCIVRSKNAIAFVGQINEVESLRLQNSFSDGIRGLDTYGMKIIAQDELQCVKIPA